MTNWIWTEKERRENHAGLGQKKTNGFGISNWMGSDAIHRNGADQRRWRSLADGDAFGFSLLERDTHRTAKQTHLGGLESRRQNWAGDLEMEAPTCRWPLEPLKWTA